MSAIWLRPSVSRDHMLDVLARPAGAARPDGTWDVDYRLKDEDELAAAVCIGRHTPEESALFHEQALTALQEARRREWPFGEGLESWRAGAGWGPLMLPAGIEWDVRMDGRQ